MIRPLKSMQIPHLQESIKEIAWDQIAESGIHALSLRGIARELNITAPAIYNYFQDRDALVTALIIEAFISFGDYQSRGNHACPGPDQLVERLLVTGTAYRDWALTYPERYNLIFGTSFSGFRIDESQTLPVMLRALEPLSGTIKELFLAGRLKITGVPLFDQASFPASNPFKIPMSHDELLVYCISMLIWSRVHGIVSLEITGGYPPFGGDAEALYRFEMESIVRQFID